MTVIAKRLKEIVEEWETEEAAWQEPERETVPRPDVKHKPKRFRKPRILFTREAAEYIGVSRHHEQ